MSRIRPVLGYAGAATILLLALLTPFVLYGWFQNVIGAAGLKIHPVYSGGEVSSVVLHGNYSVRVNEPVLRKTPLQRFDSFVQITWTPARSLPQRVSEELDIDHDGKPDALVEFDVPKDQSQSLEVTVTPRSSRVLPMRARGTRSMYALIARVKDTIVVRLPVVAPAG